MTAEKVLVTNIQRFSIHDGPRIRTTIFFKGCSLRCPWCSNPENLNARPQIYLKDEAKGVYGKWHTPDELYVEIVKDRIFYDNKEERLRGGVTFSDGEALLQMEKLKPLLERLKFEGIHTAIETCLFTLPNMSQQEDALTIALDFIDLFYIDIKILDKKRCKDILYGDINLYLSNLEKVLYKEKLFVLRIPVIGVIQIW